MPKCCCCNGCAKERSFSFTTSVTVVDFFVVFTDKAFASLQKLFNGAALDITSNSLIRQTPGLFADSLFEPMRKREIQQPRLRILIKVIHITRNAYDVLIRGAWFLRFQHSWDNCQ